MTIIASSVFQITISSLSFRLMGSKDKYQLKWDSSKKHMIVEEKSLARGYDGGGKNYPQMIEAKETFYLSQGKLHMDVHETAWLGKLKTGALPEEGWGDIWDKTAWDKAEKVRQMDDMEYTVKPLES